MAFRFGDGSGYCDFARAFAKYPLAGFFGSGPNTLLGSIDAGPWPGTSAVRIFKADPIYQHAIDLGNQQEWTVAMWVKPKTVASTRSLLIFLDRTVPNLGTQFAVQIRPDGHLQIGTGYGLNVFVFPFSFSPIDPSFVQGINATSTARLPDGVWSHICIRVKFADLSAGGRARLWVNGALDIDATGTTNPTSKNYANWIAPVWQSTDGSEISRSQLFVWDTNGSLNNGSPIRPQARVTTLFPVADGSRRGWTPIPAYSQVNENPGPDGDASFVACTSLGFADGDLQFLPLPGHQSNMAVLANYSLEGSGQAAAGLVTPFGGSPAPFGSLVAPASYATLQAVSEVNPATGQPWLDPDVGEAAWGIRGLSGTGEKLSQMFLEKVWQTGLGSYGY